MKTASPVRTALLLALVLPLAGLSGCDLLTGSDDASESINGTWVLLDGSSYLEITSSTFTVYDEEDGGCFTVLAVEILSRDGDRYTLSPVGSDIAYTYTIRRDGDDLLVIFEGETLTYQPSNQDVARLDVCTGGGDDPSIVCSSLPAVAVGQTINGELTTSDPVTDGRYFDLYGLTLTAGASVRIDAGSDIVDTYLYLYQGDGTLVTTDDDGGTDTDSRIAITLQAGCYRIEVTSYFSDETGPYTLAVN